MQEQGDAVRDSDESAWHGVVLQYWYYHGACAAVEILAFRNEIVRNRIQYPVFSNRDPMCSTSTSTSVPVQNGFDPNKKI